MIDVIGKLSKISAEVNLQTTQLTIFTMVITYE